MDRHYAGQADIAQSTLKAWSSVNATDLTPHLNKITSPTLVIFGKQDGTVPIEQAHLFKEKCAAAQLVIFDECGHFPMYENFDRYSAALESFL
jgi:2-hydroxy-6-oxonona-2,4-dienedioate hydrolase